MNCAIHDILFWNNNIHFVFFFLFSSMPLSRNCSAVKIARFWNTKQNCGNSGDNQLWHRGCCHNINNANSDYLTPSKKAIEAGIKMLGMDEIVPKAKPISHLLKNTGPPKWRRQNIKIIYLILVSYAICCAQQT